MAKKKAPAVKKNHSKHIEALRQMRQSELEEFLTSAPTATLLDLVEETYSSDLVNLFLNLRKSAVKVFFERLVPLRRKLIIPLMTLYSYKEYLTNPLPLTIHSVDGEAVPNCYAILGVPRDAADEQLKEAYNLLSKAMAPETLAPEARKAGELRLNEVNAAYDAVKTPKRREKTDTILPNISYLYPRRELSWFEKVKKFLD